MTDEQGDHGFSIVELLIVMLILGLVAWLATGQVGRPSAGGQGSDVAERRFTDARLAAARLGTPQVLEYGAGRHPDSPEGGQARVVIFPDGTFLPLSEVGEEAGFANPPGLSRRIFHGLEVR